MTDEVRARLLAPFAELPEAAIEEVGPHVRLTVRGKTVGWAMENHHGNQRLEIHFKVAREMQASVVDRDPRVLFTPNRRASWLGGCLARSARGSLGADCRVSA